MVQEPRSPVAAVLGACLLLAASLHARSHHAFVIDSSSEADQALGVALEMLEVGDIVSVHSAGGKPLLLPREVTAEDLKGALPALWNDVARGFPRLENAPMHEGMLAAALQDPPADRVIVISSRPVAALHSADLEELRAAGPRPLPETWLVAPVEMDDRLCAALGRLSGGLEALSARAPQALARSMGNCFYRTQRGPFPVPAGCGDLVAYVPRDVDAELELGGRALPEGRVGAREVPGWRVLRLVAPEPGLYELVGMPAGRQAVVVTHLPWRARVGVDAGGGLELEFTSVESEPLPELRLTVTEHPLAGLGELGRTAMVREGSGRERAGAALWRGRLPPTFCGSVVLSMELSAPDFGEGLTGWVLRDRRCLCGFPEEGARQPREGDTTGSAAPRGPAPRERAELLVTPDEIALGRVQPGVETDEIAVGLRWSNGDAPRVQAALLELHDQSGLAVECPLILATRLPAVLREAGGRFVFRIIVPASCRATSLRGTLTIRVADAADQLLPVRFDLRPVLLRWEPEELTVHTQAGTETSVERQVMVLHSTSLQQTGLQLTATPLRSSGGADATGVTLHLPPHTPRAGGGSSPGVEISVSVEPGTRAGLYTGSLIARTATGVEAIAPVVVHVAATALAPAQTSLELVPVAGDGIILAGSIGLVGGDASAADLDLLASLDSAPAGAEVMAAVRQGRLWVHVYVPDDEVGTPVSGALTVSPSAPDGGKPWVLAFHSRREDR